MSPEEDRTHDTVDSEPKHYQLSYSGPKTQHVIRIDWKLCKKVSVKSFCFLTKMWSSMKVKVIQTSTKMYILEMTIQSVGSSDVY